MHARWIAATALFTALNLVVVPAARAAAACESASKVAVDLWDEYGKYAKQLGCVGVTIGAVAASEGAAAGEAKTIYKECLDNANKREKMVRDMIKTFNELADNSWATIGPRELPLSEQQSGTIVGLGTRLFVTPAPVHTDAVNVVVRKRAHRGKGTMTVCKYGPDGEGQELWSFTIEPGKSNIGKTWRRTIDDAKGYLLSVHLVGKSAKRLAYSVEVLPSITIPPPESDVVQDEADAEEAPEPEEPEPEPEVELVSSCRVQLPTEMERRLERAGEDLARPGMPANLGDIRPDPTPTVAGPPAEPVVAFTPAGGWVIAAGTRSFARNIPDEAYERLNQMTDRGKRIDAIAFTPTGGWAIAAEDAYWTRNVGGAYHDTVADLIRQGRRVRDVAFQPVRWPSLRGFVIAHDRGFVARHIPPEMCDRLRAFTNQGKRIDAVAFTPQGGWAIVVDGGYWTRRVGGTYHGTVSALMQDGRQVRDIAFRPVEDRVPGWAIVTEDSFASERVPAELRRQLARTLQLAEARP